MSMLSTLVSPAYSRSWILSGAHVDAQTLLKAGFISESYSQETKNEVIATILGRISRLAPVQRIQAKLGLFESLRSQFENGIVMDRKIAKASMVSEDWRSKKPETKEFGFMPAKSMSYSVKLSLVKSDETPTLEQ